MNDDAQLDLDLGKYDAMLKALDVARKTVELAKARGEDMGLMVVAYGPHLENPEEHSSGMLSKVVQGEPGCWAEAGVSALLCRSVDHRDIMLARLFEQALTDYSSNGQDQN